MRPLGQELYLRLDSGDLILREGHLGAEGPPVVHIQGQVGRASHEFCLNDCFTAEQTLQCKKCYKKARYRLI